MPKVIIEIKATKTFITYESDNNIILVCNFDDGGFNINEITSKVVLKLIAELIYRCGIALKCRVIGSNKANKPLNKPSDCK